MNMRDALKIAMLSPIYWKMCLAERWQAVKHVQEVFL